MLPGVKEFFAAVPDSDRIVLLTARKQSELAQLENFLRQRGIRFDAILCDMPQGERILVNDSKPSGLLTAYAVNKKRDSPLEVDYVIDPNL